MTAERAGCQVGIVVPVANRMTIIIDALGGKKLAEVASRPLGSLAATSQDMTGKSSMVQTGNRSV